MAVRKDEGDGAKAQQAACHVTYVPPSKNRTKHVGIHRKHGRRIANRTVLPL